MLTQKKYATQTQEKYATLKGKKYVILTICLWGPFLAISQGH